MKDLLTQAHERLRSPRAIPAAAMLAVAVGVVLVPRAFATLALALCLIGWVVGGLVGLAVTRRLPERLPERALRRQGAHVWRLLGAAVGLVVAVLCVGYTTPAWLLKAALGAFLVQDVLPLPRALRKNDGWDGVRLLPTLLTPLRKPVVWVAIRLLVLAIAAGIVAGLVLALRPLLALPVVGYPVAGAVVGLWVGAAISLWVVGRRSGTRTGWLAFGWAPSTGVICWATVLVGAAAGHVARRLDVVLPGAWMAVLGCVAAPGIWLLVHPRHRRIAVELIRRRAADGAERLALPMLASGVVGGGAIGAATTGALPVATVLLYSVAVLVWLVFWTTPDLVFGVSSTPPADSTGTTHARLPPLGRQWAHTTGALAGLNTAVMLAAPLIALGRAESNEHEQRLLFFVSATMVVGVVGLLMSRFGGAATPRKVVAVGTVAVPGLAFMIDRLVETDVTFLIAFAASGFVIPLLSTLGDQSASRFPTHEDEYHGRRNQVAARFSAVAVCLPLLQGVGLGRWVSVLLALAFAIQAAALARLKWFETTQSSGALAWAVARIPALARRFDEYIQNAPRAGEKVGGWAQPVFGAAVTLFFIGQLLGTAAGTAVSTVMDGAGLALVMGLWLPLSRLVASASFGSAGKLTDDRLKQRGIVRAGILFVVGGVAFWLTGLVEGTWQMVAAGVALFALTMGLNPLLVIARALVSRYVAGKTPMVDLGWTGTAAGAAGAAIIPAILPPGPHGEGTNLVAFGVIALGFAAFVLTHILRWVLTKRGE